MNSRRHRRRWERALRRLKAESHPFRSDPFRVICIPCNRVPAAARCLLPAIVQGLRPRQRLLGRIGTAREFWCAFHVRLFSRDATYRK